jgi:cytochrome oxidase Cu insertion factor (SCO1/SenC/PrrC family)
MLSFYKKYFDKFTKKDVNFLNEIFDDNIKIIDWTGEAIGKNEAIEFNKNIFNNIQNINIKIINYSINDASAFFQLVINADGEIIKVIDVIHIKNNKILSIEAYKQ